MPAPAIAFLTDFGTRDHYVGAMKGAALTIAPEATLVDITHGIAPQDILGGAIELRAAWRYFPPATIYVAVVDPGVGSPRRGLAARVGDHFFVAPDNGLLTLVFREVAPAAVVELVDPRFALPVVSRTFEGRDRFAPAAAWLARGIALEAFGPAVHDWRTLPVPDPTVAGGRVTGEVLQVDTFGNLVTNIPAALVPVPAPGRRLDILVAGSRVPTLVDTYASVPAGSLCALVGSSGYLEVAVTGGNAAGDLGVGRGAVVSLTTRS